MKASTAILVLQGLLQEARCPADEAALEEAIRALEATHPQPVTPAGGEVGTISELGGKVIVLYNEDVIGRLPKGTKLYTHPHVADAALVDAARDVLSHREGTQPIKGWLRDNDASRTALTRLDASLNQRGGG